MRGAEPMIAGGHHTARADRRAQQVGSMEWWSWAFLASVVQILVIDVVLSGDNAVVIALAAHRLPLPQRRLAIVCGAGGAIALRVLFTAIVALMLGVPLLRFVGGIVLVWISMKLLLQEEADRREHVREAGNLLQAIWTIVVADFVMSLDNMLAVAGAAGDHPWLIVFGLLFSIAFIMTCSAVIANLMNRWPILVIVGAAVLALTAGEMIADDATVGRFLITRTETCMHGGWHKLLQSGGLHVTEHRHWVGWSTVAAVVLFVVSSPYWWRVLGPRGAGPVPQPGSAAGESVGAQRAEP